MFRINAYPWQNRNTNLASSHDELMQKHFLICCCAQRRRCPCYNPSVVLKNSMSIDIHCNALWSQVDPEANSLPTFGYVRFHALTLHSTTQDRDMHPELILVLVGSSGTSVLVYEEAKSSSEVQRNRMFVCNAKRVLYRKLRFWRHSAASAKHSRNCVFHLRDS